MTFLVSLFAVTSYLLAIGGGDAGGIWVALIIGGILIATWISNVIQLYYRKRHGVKFFKIAPLHHHLEAVGIPGGAVVNYYMLTTFLLVFIGFTIILAGLA